MATLTFDDPLIPRKQSWWGGVSQWLRSNIVSKPQSFSDRDKEAREILGNNEHFEGLKIDINRMLVGSQITNTLQLPPGDNSSSYQFLVVRNTEKFTTLGVYNTENQGRVIWKSVYSPTPKSSITFQTQVGEQSNTSLDLDYKGDDSVSEVKFSGNNFSVSYMQSVFKNIFFGTEMLHLPGQGTMLNLGMRLVVPREKTSSDSELDQMFPNDHVLSCMYSSQHLWTLSYTKCAKTAEFATEFMRGVRPQDGQPYDTTAAGFAMGYRTARLKARMDTQWKLHAHISEVINQVMSLSIATEVDWKEYKGKVGFGLTINC